MILTEFVEKVFNRYKCTAPDIEDKKAELMDLFITKCDKIDFQKLLTVISKEHENDFLPAPAKILEWSYGCYKTEFKKSYKNEWLHVKVFNPLYNAVTNTDCFPAGTTEQQMIATYKKMFPNTEGWKIVEVY